jgi:ABC-type multidrug transport system fused ATPase/permease subunit
MIGVASIVPFMAVVGDPGVIESNAVLRAVYEYFGSPGQREFLAGLGVTAFVALVISLSFGAATQWAMNRYGHVFNYRLSVRLLCVYFSRPYVWFLETHSVDLGRRTLHAIVGLVSQTIIPMLRIASKLIVVVFLLTLVILVNPIIALLAALVFSSLYAVVYLAVRHYLAKSGLDVWKAEDERFRIVYEAFGAIKQVKIAGLEAEYLSRYRTPADRVARLLANQATLGLMPKFLMEAIAFGGILLILVVLILSQEQSLGRVLPIVTVYAFTGYRLMPALQSLYFDFATMRSGQPSLDLLEPDLLAGLKVPAPQFRQFDPHATLVPETSIRLEDVSFTYSNAAAPALDRITLEIPANRSVAFVGTTGAGKSTIVDLILGLLEADSGRLFVDGIEITAANRHQWQEAIGYVPQDIFLKDDSIAANIAFGVAPDAIDRSRVELAARSAELHEFIVNELPDGYDTWIGERGVRLSGGQRQRIAIARALYRDPPVLVFDEATSALDTLTERAVMAAVDLLGTKKTIIIVAHRLSTVRRCDKIFLLEHGRLVGSGSFDELTASNAQFRAMSAGGA